MSVASVTAFFQIGTLVFLGALLLVALGNLAGMRRVKHASAPDPEPFVSVLVPARNESANIEACVRSLLDQEYADYELIVLDDESTDGTGEILVRLATQTPRLRLLPGEPLPDGWVGKNWACDQLARAARGDFLLFTDADTRHHPGMLRDTLALAIATQADFLSGMPAEETGSWAERLAIPMIAWMAHTTTPIPLVRALPLDLAANAIGQFVLFRRTTYDRIGGHAAVRASVIEDFDLPQRVKRLGLRWDLVDVSARVRTRMYHSPGEVWDGYTKNLFAAFGYHLPAFAFVWLWMLFVAWTPLIGLLLQSLGHPPAGFSPALAQAAYALDCLLWLLSDLRFDLPFWQAFLHPLTVAFFAAVAVRSAQRYLLRRPVAWKDRPLPRRA